MKPRKTTKQVAVFDSQHNSPVMFIEEEIEQTFFERFFLNPEVWQIFATLIMQDIPFLVVRLYVSTIFFISTSKKFYYFLFR